MCVAPASLSTTYRRAAEARSSSSPGRVDGVQHARDIGEDERARVVQGRHDFRGRAHAGDDQVRPVADENGKVVREPRVGRVHDEVGADGRGRRARVLLGRGDALAHGREPLGDVSGALGAEFITVQQKDVVTYTG